MAASSSTTNPSADPARLDDLVLAEAARNGDRAAFEQIVHRYEHRIFRLAQRMMGNAEDAEDVLQETFLKVHSRLHQFQGNSRLYTWIVRIAVNEALMKLRRRKDAVSLDQEIEGEDGPITRDVADWHPNPEQQYETAELGGILQRALHSLALPYRLVFQLRDVEELSTEETAEALHISVPAVKSRLLRARLQLRDKLTHHFRVTAGAGAHSGGS